MAVTGKKWVLAKLFEEEPKLSDFQIVEEEISTDLKEGGEYSALVNECLCISRVTTGNKCGTNNALVVTLLQEIKMFGKRCTMNTVQSLCSEWMSVYV